MRDPSLGWRFKFFFLFCLFASLSHWKLQIWEKRADQVVEVQTRWPKLAVRAGKKRRSLGGRGTNWQDPDNRGKTIGLERVLEGAWKLCLSLSLQTKSIRGPDWAYFALLCCTREGGACACDFRWGKCSRGSNRRCRLAGAVGRQKPPKPTQGGLLDKSPECAVDCHMGTGYKVATAYIP